MFWILELWWRLWATSLVILEMSRKTRLFNSSIVGRKVRKIKSTMFESLVLFKFNKCMFFFIYKIILMLLILKMFEHDASTKQIHIWYLSWLSFETKPTTNNKALIWYLNSFNHLYVIICFMDMHDNSTYDENLYFVRFRSIIVLNYL